MNPYDAYKARRAPVEPMLDISVDSGEPPAAAATADRPFLSIYFRCCSVYQRIYKTADGTAYAGCCPRCLKPLRVGIGSDGCAARTFTAQCRAPRAR